jgi:glycolate oxidase iron-sulfur subunit
VKPVKPVKLGTRERASLYGKTLACVHCGLCLPACPAYGAAPRESLAPRGQVYNVRAVLEGRLELTDALASEIYDCLACRGCESVCPSGVPVGAIMEQARGLITEEKKESLPLRTVKRFFLAGVLAHPRRLAILMGILRIYELSRLRALVSSLLGVVSPRLCERERLLPTLTRRRTVLPELASPSGDRRKRVALFTGCIASHLFSDVNEATLRVLRRNGFEVVVPRDQRCCGALHLHNGLPDTGRRLALENIAAFENASADYLVVNAAGCGAALSEYGELLEGEARAKEFAGRVVDVAALLVREGFEPPKASLGGVRVAYDPPCHLFHAQKVKTEPRELLSRIPGIELVEHRDSERCCGSAGIYNVTHYEMSMQVLEAKMGEIAKVRPDIVATGNPGCHMQLSEGVRRRGLRAEVAHPVVLLDRAYARENG